MRFLLLVLPRGVKHGYQRSSGLYEKKTKSLLLTQIYVWNFGHIIVSFETWYIKKWLYSKLSSYGPGVLVERAGANVTALCASGSFKNGSQKIVNLAIVYV